MNRSGMDQIQELMSRGRRFQGKQSWKEAQSNYLSAADLMLEMAKAGDGATKARWLGRAKALQEIATKLKALEEVASKPAGVSAPVQGKAPTLVEEANRSAEEPWLVDNEQEVTFADVAGYEDVKEEIRHTILYPFSHAEVADYYKVEGGGGIILYGPHGVGKTHFARAVAGELGVPFFCVKSSDILSKFVGEAEQNIAKLFAAARSYRQAVILIDEVEKLMPSRDAVSSPVMPRVVSQLLEEMNGFARQKTMLLLIGNTNLPWLIDDAFLNPRRFGRQIYIPLPDIPAIEEIMRIHLRKVPCDESLRLDELAPQLEGYSGADVDEICKRACISVFVEVVRGAQTRPVTQQDMKRAIAQSHPTVSSSLVRRFEEYEQQGARMSRLFA